MEHLKRHFAHCAVIAVLLTGATSLWAQTRVVATGLQTPQRLILTAGGNFLASETAAAADQGRISFVTRAGVRRSLFEGMPSGANVVGDPSGPSALAVRERTLYIGIGAGDIEREGPSGAPVHNPAGISSPIFNSVLQARFNMDVDALSGTFKLTRALQQNLADGDEITLDDGAGGQARVMLLVDFPDSVPQGNQYQFSNIWGMALSDDGATLWVADASGNTLIKVDTATGRWQRIMRFTPLPNPSGFGPPVVDTVPTSVRVRGNTVLVSFLTGFPFVPGYARVLQVNPANRTADPFIFSVTSVVDVLWRDRAPGVPQFFVLEFSKDMLYQPTPPGRLVRYDTPVPEVVVHDLMAPVSMAFDPATEEVFILELTGRILAYSAR